MFQKTEPLENLVDQFARFPGIGRKSAVRMAYQVMSMPAEQAMELAQAIEHAKRICTAAVSVRTSPQVMSARSVRPKSGTAA